MTDTGLGVGKLGGEQIASYYTNAMWKLKERQAVSVHLIAVETRLETTKILLERMILEMTVHTNTIYRILHFTLNQLEATLVMLARVTDMKGIAQHVLGPFHATRALNITDY